MRERVLMLGPDPSLPGGVAAFLKGLYKAAAAQVQIQYFRVGFRPEEAGGRLGRSVADMVCLLRICSKGKFDAIHVNPSLTLRSVVRDGLYLIGLRGRGTDNVIVTFHGWDWRLAQEIERRSWARVLFRMAFGWTRKLLVLDEAFGGWLAGIGIDARKIDTYTTLFDAEEAVAGQAMQAKRADGTIRVLFLARVIKEKGVGELVEALRLVGEDWPRFYLDIAGDGPAVNEMKETVQHLGLGERVRFLGYVHGEEKWRVLRSADIFVLPSYREGCPIAILEAMAAGLPILTTAVGGIPRIVEDGVNGIVLEKPEPERIAQALRHLAQHSDLRSDISRLNREIAWNRYSSTVVVMRFVKLYKGGD